MIQFKETRLTEPGKVFENPEANIADDIKRLNFLVNENNRLKEKLRTEESLKEKYKQKYDFFNETYRKYGSIYPLSQIYTLDRNLGIVEKSREFLDIPKWKAEQFNNLSLKFIKKLKEFDLQNYKQIKRGDGNFEIHIEKDERFPDMRENFIEEGLKILGEENFSYFKQSLGSTFSLYEGMRIIEVTRSESETGLIQNKISLYIKDKNNNKRVVIRDAIERIPDEVSHIISFEDIN